MLALNIRGWPRSRCSCSWLYWCLVVWYYRIMSMLYMRIKASARNQRQSPSLTMTSPSVVRMKKTPKHIAYAYDLALDPAYVVDGADSVVEKMACTILWGFDTGAEVISIFESLGFCKKVWKQLESKIADSYAKQMRACVFKKLESVKNVYIYLGGEGEPRGKIELSTFGTRDCIVKLLSLEDGRADIARLTKDVANDHTIPLEAVNAEYIGQNLTSTAHTNNHSPELLIGFSSHNVITEYPPWLMRSAEIIHVGALRHIWYSSFYAAMVKFAHTEQRWGR